MSDTLSVKVMQYDADLDEVWVAIQDSRSFGLIVAPKQVLPQMRKMI